MSDNPINTNTNLEAKWTIGEKPTTSGVSQSNTHATSLGRKIWNSIKTFPLISLFKKHKPRQVVTLQTSPQPTTFIDKKRINYKLHECCQNFNLNSQISSQNIQKLCEHIDRFQNLNSLNIDTQKNIFLCILKNYNNLCAKTNENSSSVPTPTNNLSSNIEKIFNTLDLNKIELSDNELKDLNLASFDNNEKTNLNDLLNLLRKFHVFTVKTKILNKIHLETLKQSIINNLNAIKKEPNDSQILLPKNQTTNYIKQEQNTIDDPKATPKKSNDSQIGLLKKQITNYIEQEQSIPTDFLEELLEYLSDPSEEELKTFLRTTINVQTGSIANDLPTNQKENPTTPIPPQNSEKNHEDVPHNQLNKKAIQEEFTPHSQHAIPTQQPLQTPQPQHKKISIRQQPKPPLTQQNETKEETPPQNTEQGIVSQDIPQGIASQRLKFFNL